jgi:RNA polymerase sigma-70 factor, ECF subfamily
MTNVTDFIRGETQSQAGSRRELGHLSDEAVLALVSRGDEAALGELYDRYGRVAYGLALRIVRDRSLAEDAVQEAFLAVWRSAGSFLAEHGKPSTWILTLVHRRAVDVVRREERRRADPIDELAQPAGEATDEEAWLREAIELAYYGGFTQSELAERLGQPLGTIKSRMFVGLRRLRELLAEAGLEVDAP